jgi:hypothetical protein
LSEISWCVLSENIEEVCEHLREGEIFYVKDFPLPEDCEAVLLSREMFEEINAKNLSDED